MPPDVIGELLSRSTSQRPERLEAFMIHDKDAAGRRAVLAGRMGTPDAFENGRIGVTRTFGTAMSNVSDVISPQQITYCEKLIRPYVRCTPVIEIDAADFGLKSSQLCLKLELCQHSGSFKARGAFANLLTRKVPAAGVVAASGGNHGAAVAYAAALPYPRWHP
jgi:hypothetical protein